MRGCPILFSALALFTVTACHQKEEEEGPDYDHMVMADEEAEWTTGQEKERKVVVEDLIPDPQERIILEKVK